MINEKEIEAVELSPTKRDFYQVWNELLDTAEALSERWSPKSTNESDPGIVLLKVLTAINDKLTYTADKKILEAFMPSATQEESMRKLCDMLGYSMRYYRSAVADIAVTYKGERDLSNESERFAIPWGFYFTDADEEITYFTLDNMVFGDTITTKSIKCMEGQWVDCETNGSNLIKRENLDDKLRYYLPETQVAENGTFIWNYDSQSGELSAAWERVDNLNAKALGQRIFRFGFDSRQNMPYVEFPDDVSSLLGDGIVIRYTRTSGLSGNVNAGRINKMQSISGIVDLQGEETECSDSEFTVKNKATTTNGKNKETITEAYNSFKKTIGTFDTLVTCRDYMNKIYQLLDSNENPYVSNVLASDIRNDVNRGVTICTFDKNGIAYINGKDGTISNFDLILYPFKPVAGLNTIKEFKNSFKYDDQNIALIKKKLETQKTLAHNFVEPDPTDLACVKVYLKLNAKVSTHNKVTDAEGSFILGNIRAALFEYFNMRQLDFGEPIPFDSLLDVMEAADTRIKSVMLDEPETYVKFCKVRGDEIDVEDSDAESIRTAIAAKNVMAGKIALFNYDTEFGQALNESNAIVYPNEKGKSLASIDACWTGPVLQAGQSHTLLANQIIQFSAPSYRTIYTYPAYVNYYFFHEDIGKTPAVPASFNTLYAYLTNNRYWTDIMNNNDIEKDKYTLEPSESGSRQHFTNCRDAAKSIPSPVFYYDQDNKTFVMCDKENGEYVEPESRPDEYYHIRFANDVNFQSIANYIRCKKDYPDSEGKTSEDEPNKLGLFRISNYNSEVADGYLKENNHAYALLNMYRAYDQPFTQMFVQNVTRTENAGDFTYNNGLGTDAVVTSIEKNCEYQLTGTDKLYINYTSSETDENGTEHKEVVNKVYYAGTIIKPNFDLLPSNTNSAQPSKKSGFSFTEFDGMYTMSSTEQIEIRKEAVVYLGGYQADGTTQINGQEYAYVYWETNNDIETTSILGSDGSRQTILTFPFNEETNEYTLQDGEYFYYTDKNKTDMAYYGSGTVVRRSNSNVVLQKVKEDAENIDSETILSSGLISSIPWIAKTFDKDNYLSLHEKQYITLTEGDTFIYPRSYQLNGTEATVELPALSIEGVNWETEYKLAMNFGPDCPQTLHDGETITLNYIVEHGPNDVGPDVLAEPSTTLPIIGAVTLDSIKCNYLIQNSTGHVDVRVRKLDSATNEIIKCVDDAKVKAFKVNELTTDPTNLHNYGEHWTSYQFIGGEHGNEFTIYSAIPTYDRGVLMVYFERVSDNDNVIAYGLASENKSPTVESTPTTSQISLARGLNIFYLTPDIKSIRFVGTNSRTGVVNKSIIVISDIDLYNYKTSLNPLIAADDGNALFNDIYDKCKALADANNIVWYSNVPVDQSNMIDLSTTDGTTLMSPSAFYDYDNVYNRATISEIDADYLTTGLQIARSSKK